MKPLCVFLVWILVSGAALTAQAPRVRLIDPLASMAYIRGHDQSGTFRALVAELEASDLIVHIVTATGLPGSVAGTTRFAGRGGESRYVRIDLSAVVSKWVGETEKRIDLAAWLTAKQRVSILAHELQHACEIARSGARSSSAIDALFRAIGTSTTIPGGFETAQAEAAGRTVWIELDAWRVRTRISGR